MKITTTTEQAKMQGIKILVHGPPGAGKTRLCATTPDREHTIILSAESGLLSLRHVDIAVIVIRSIDDMREALAFLRTEDGAKYQWVCIDSLSEIAEVCLREELDKVKDPRKAYGELATIMQRLIRAFRDLPRNVVMTAKTERIDNGGALLWAPWMPGNQLKQGVSYYFDEVFAMCAQGREDGTVQRWLQTNNDGVREAKDRSGALDPAEPADLAHIARKIEQPTTTTEDKDNG
jgi:phage nucleotide-binding protein